MMIKTPGLCLLFAAAFAATPLALGDNPTAWTGISGTDWDGTGSWTNGVPDETSDVMMVDNVNGNYIFVEGTSSRTVSSLTMNMWGAMIKLNAGIPAFTVINDLNVGQASATSMAYITSQNSTGSPGSLNASDASFGNINVTKGILYLGMSNVLLAKFNVLKDISVNGNLSIAEGGTVNIASQTFTVGDETIMGNTASIGAFSDISFDGGVTLSNSSITVYKKPNSSNDPFETDHGSLYFGAGINGSGTVTNEISGSMTTFRNAASSSRFTGNVVANAISIEGGFTQAIDGSISHADGVNITIKDGSTLLTTSTVRIDTLTNEGGNATLGNNILGINYQTVELGSLLVEAGTTFTFNFDLSTTDTRSDKLTADYISFLAKDIVFHFSGGTLGEYEVGEFLSMEGFDFSTDANDLFAYTSSNPYLDGYFEWDNQTLKFIVTRAIPEPATATLIFGALALSFSRRRRI